MLERRQMPLAGHVPRARRGKKTLSAENAGDARSQCMVALQPRRCTRGLSVTFASRYIGPPNPAMVTLAVEASPGADRCVNYADSGCRLNYASTAADQPLRMDAEERVGADREPFASSRKTKPAAAAPTLRGGGSGCFH